MLRLRKAPTHENKSQGLKTVTRARTHKIRFGKRGSLNVCFAPEATGLLHRHELQRWAMCGRLRVGKENLHVAGGRAEADDLSGAMPVKAPARSYDWNGFYVGGHIANGTGRGTGTLSDPNPTLVGNSFGSLYGGMQGGYNYVFPSGLLLGAEADVTFPNFQTYADGLIFTGGTVQGTTVTDQIDYIATLRGRFGYAFDHWLVYGTGGFAWSQARFSETPVAGNPDTILLTRTGWALGLGAELAIAPSWTARIEYLYVRLPWLRRHCRGAPASIPVDVRQV